MEILDSFCSLSRKCDHSVVKWKIYSHLFSNFFSKHVAFTKFLTKKCESKFLFLPHCGKNAKFSVKFRQITDLVISLVKMLLSRNFLLRKCESKSSFLPHCVHVTLWKLRKFTFTLTEKIFRQISYLVISLVKLLISRNFCQKSVKVNSRNFHTVHVWL